MLKDLESIFPLKILFEAFLLLEYVLILYGEN